MERKIPKNKNTALGYNRVSTDDQADNGISLDYQEQQCRTAAIRDGYTDIKIIKDEGKSGKNLNRKGIQEVIELAKNREISIIYVTHSDRLARNIVDHSFLRHTFLSNGVQLKYLNGQSSGEDACSIMADNMFATINQYHSDNTREKTRQATDAKALAGYYPTHAPIGFTNCKNPDQFCEKVAKKIIVPHPKVGPLVTEAFKLYATGQYNALELNDMMYEKGLVSHTNKKLAPSMFYDMLRNRIYLGEIHWRDINVKDGKHEHLIDETTFNQVKNIIDGNTNNRCRRRKYFWLLTGYIFCAIHKRRYTAEWHLAKGKAYYHCSNPTGCGKYIEKSDLEKQVANKFKNVQLDRGFIDSIIAKVKETYETRKQSYDTNIRGLLNQKNAWEAKLKTAEDRLLDETLSKPDYTRIRDEISGHIDRINHKISELKKTKEINVDALAEILNFTRDIYQTYLKAPERIQKRLIDFFFDKFEVKDGIIIAEHYSPLFQELLHQKTINLSSVSPEIMTGNIKDFSFARELYNPQTT